MQMQPNRKVRQMLQAEKWCWFGGTEEKRKVEMEKGIASSTEIGNFTLGDGPQIGQQAIAWHKRKHREQHPVSHWH